ncbi:hypothetical protein TTHERM_00348330 (macronuclear) [Tetrahymena thermophila SB210]|uniref:Uncharacterized protein n=1 Tax=Tetrahymena thermophila (strain SB210) TaxID=312017 RepID=I7MLN2_TETTS|nr:hypothetical protein TTHERM_00348330 [Tetrahymena thermophila SB210]EAS02743.3 hypothetical protein TTHERM_00348330 [Tetrahymena thermophila SB210]|eukprot:XP_001022988.3 hypothetical protein TTHERM_00348330 [Tetrahymena thermophila SB210]
MEDISTQFLNYLISQQNSDISTDFFPENDELINILQDYFLMLYQIQNQKYVGTFCNLQNCIQFVQKETYYKLLKQKEDENEQSQNTNNQNEDNKKFTNFPLKELSSMLNDKDKEKIDLKNIFKQCIKYSQQNHAENPFEIESIEPNFTKVIQANKHNEQLDKNPYSVKEGYLNSIYNEKKKIDFSKENVIDLTDDTYQRKQDDDRRYNQQQIYNQKNMSYDFKQQDKRHFVNQQHQNREMIIIDGESNKNHYSNNRPNKIQDSRPVSPNRRSQERKNLRDDYFDQKHHSIKQDNNRQLSSSQYNSINNLRERDRSYNNKGSEEHRKQLNNIQNNKFQNNQKQYQNNQGYNNYSNKYNFNNGRYQDYRYNRRLSSERGERRSQSRYREEDTPLRSRPKGNDWESNYQKKKSVSSSSSSSSQSSSRSVQRSNNKRSQDQSYLRRNSNQFSVSPQHKNSQSPQIRNRNQSDSQSKLSIHSNQRISEQKLLYHQNGNKSVNIPQIAAKTIGNNNQTQQFKQLQQNKFIGQKLNSNSNINIDGNGYNSPEKQINNYKPFKNSPVRSNQDKFQFQTSTRNKPQENFQFNFQIPSHIKPPSQIINPVIQQNGLQQFPNNIAQTPTNTIDNQHEIKSVIQQQVFPPQPQQDQKFQNFLMFNPYSNIQQIPQKSNQTFNPFYGQSNLLTKGLEKQQSNN